MSAAYKKLIKHFKKHQVQYLAERENQTVRVDVCGVAAIYRLVSQVDNNGLLLVLGYAPFLVPEGGRPAVAETIVRANFGLRVGKLELNLNDGELRFQAAHILVNDDLEEHVIVQLFGTTIRMLDRYLPAILSVIYGNALPLDAVRYVEADWPS